MVRYEIAMILRPVGERYIEKMYKDIARTILEEGGIIRKLTNLGERKLPQKMKAHDVNFERGRYVRVTGSIDSLNYYFLLCYDHFLYFSRYMICDIEAGPKMRAKIDKRLHADERVIRSNMLKLTNRILKDRGEIPA